MRGDGRRRDRPVAWRDDREGCHRVVIRFDNVTKRFPDGTNAVDHLSIDMPTGEITVLVGSSGCGKTTSCGW